MFADYVLSLWRGRLQLLGGFETKRSGSGCISGTQFNEGAKCQDLGREVAGRTDFPSHTHGILEDGQFGTLWQNADLQILLISQGSHHNVLRMVGREHGSLMMKQQIDPLRGRVSQSLGNYAWSQDSRQSEYLQKRHPHCYITLVETGDTG